MQWPYKNLFLAILTNLLLFLFISKDILILNDLPKHPLMYADASYIYGQR